MTHRVVQEAVFAGLLSQEVILEVGDVRIVGELPVSYCDAEEMNWAVRRFVEAVQPVFYRKMGELARDCVCPVVYTLD